MLDRYFRAAQLAKAEVIVRITSDCPLIDPQVTDKTIAAFMEASPDYASNVHGANLSARAGYGSDDCQRPGACLAASAQAL